MRKYKESTPLEDRDEVAAFQAQKDKEEATPASEKYKGELDKRNEKYYHAWQKLITEMNKAVESKEEGYLLGSNEFMNEGYLEQTGYYDSASLYTSPGINDCNCESQGIGIYFYGAGKDGEELGGDFIEDGAPAIKKCNGAQVIVIGYWAMNSAEAGDLWNDIEYGRLDIKTVVNLHIKSMIKAGYSRKDVAAEAHFLSSDINPSMFKGCDDAYIQYRVSPEVDLVYTVSPIPTDEEIKNIVSGIKTLISNMSVIGDIKF